MGAGAAGIDEIGGARAASPRSDVTSFLSRGIEERDERLIALGGHRRADEVQNRGRELKSGPDAERQPGRLSE